MNKIGSGLIITGLLSILLLCPILSEAYEEIEVQDSGSISGHVKYSGKVEAPAQLEVAKDQTHCGTSKPSEELLVSSSGMVKNAVVFIESIDAGKKISADVKSIDNKGCMFVPHVQSITTYSKMARNYLEIINSDPVLHNIHGYLDDVTTFNLALPLQDQKVKKKVKKPGLISIKCDAGHTWMSGYIMVVEHPYHATTGDDGAFELTNVPPGNYKLKAWHEKLGTQVVDVVVDKGGKANALFDNLTSQ